MSDWKPPEGTLGALLAARGLKASGTEPTAVVREPPAPGWSLDRLPKVVVRVERKGHGGKTVTCVDGLAGASPDDLEALARDLRKGMGTGARVEGGAVVVQGDLRERVTTWLSARGARRVVG